MSEIILCGRSRGFTIVGMCDWECTTSDCLLTDLVRFRSAPFGLAMFVGAMGLMEGLDFQGVKRKFSDVSRL